MIVLYRGGLTGWFREKFNLMAKTFEAGTLILNPCYRQS
jgi:hypothetical protein